MGQRVTVDGEEASGLGGDPAESGVAASKRLRGCSVSEEVGA